MKTDSKTLITALRILANEIQSDDGVANSCIEEAANRIEEMENELYNLKIEYDHLDSELWSARMQGSD